MNICPWGDWKHKEMEAQVVNGQLARGQCQVENTGSCSWNSTAIFFQGERLRGGPGSEEVIPKEKPGRKVP